MYFGVSCLVFHYRGDVSGSTIYSNYIPPKEMLFEREGNTVLRSV
jgi:hypothetical protein